MATVESILAQLDQLPAIVRAREGELRAEIVRLEAELAAERGHEICSGCKNEIDPNTCYCGTDKPSHPGVGDGGHSFTAMGCRCHAAEFVVQPEGPVYEFRLRVKDQATADLLNSFFARHPEDTTELVDFAIGWVGAENSHGKW